MGDPTLLNLDTIAAGQQQMYQTSNDADSEIEKATNDWLAVAMSADVVLTGPQFTRSFTFVLSGTVTHNLTVPASKRIFAVQNESSAPQNVVRGSASIAVAAGDVAIFKTDGTTNGLVTLVGSSGSSGSAGGDLTGTYPNPTIGANKVGNTKLAQMATDTIKGNDTGGNHDPKDLSVSEVKVLLALAVADITGAAPLASPALTGTPTAPTAGGGTNTTQLATTAFVSAAIAAIAGGLTFKGTWNATTNSPSIVSSTGTLGWFYKVATAGTTTIDGISQWNVGDVLLFDGSTWDKLDGLSSEVVSVAGLVGVITASALKTALAIASTDVSGLATIATSGSASDLGSGTVPNARSANVRFCPSTFMAGLQTGANQLVLSFVAPIAMVIPSGGTNSQAVSQAAATGSTTFTMKKNGSSVGTIVWSGAGTVAAFTVSSTVNLAAGDVLTIVGPASADATLADVAITIYATAAVQ